MLQLSLVYGPPHPPSRISAAQVVLDHLSEVKPSEAAQITMGFAALGHDPGRVYFGAIVDSMQWNIAAYGTQVRVQTWHACTCRHMMAMCH